jgi:hypothetical protein
MIVKIYTQEYTHADLDRRKVIFAVEGRYLPFGPLPEDDWWSQAKKIAQDHKRYAGSDSKADWGAIELQGVIGFPD